MAGIRARQPMGESEPRSVVADGSEINRLATPTFSDGSNSRRQRVVQSTSSINTPGREETGPERVSHANSCQRILKACLFTGNEVLALHCERQPEIGITAEAPLAMHGQSDASLEHRNGSGDVLEPSKHAARRRPSPAMHEQIGVSERRQLIVEADPVAVGHLSVEHVAGRNRIGHARAAAEYKANVDAEGACLGEQRMIERG